MDCSMTRFILSFTAVALAVVLPVHADQASKSKKIEEIFELTKADQSIKAMQAQTRAGLQSQLAAVGIRDAQAIGAELDRVLKPLMEESLSWDKMKPRMVRLYDETFSEEEIAGMLDFYHSPTGRAMIDKMPALLSKSVALSQEMMRDVMPKLLQAVPAIVEKYEKNNPELPAPPPPAPPAPKSK
jgi:hypothetical protein